MTDEKVEREKIRKVLVTGSAGLIGRAVCRSLAARGHIVRGLDRVESPELADFRVGDLTVPEEIAAAMEDIQVVVHLAATPHDDDFVHKLLPNNIEGTYRVFEAARKCGVERVVAASSVQVVDGLVGEGRVPVRVEDGTAPMNHYAVSKVFAEQLGWMYAHQHGLSVLMVRPGWVPREVSGEPAGNPRIYLSHDDAGRFFTACVESDKPARPGYGVAFALSRCHGEPTYDLTSARELIGYEPRDIWPEGLPRK